MPTKKEIEQTVQSSTPLDWEGFDEPEVLVYRPDRDLSIRRCGEWTPHTAAWLNRARYSKRMARLAKFRTLYRGSPYAERAFVSVDGGKCLFPTPHLDGGDDPPTPYHTERDRFLGDLCTRVLRNGDYDRKRRQGNIDIR